MKKRYFLFAALFFAFPAFAQVPVVSPVPTTQPETAKLFRSRLAGIQFLPPAGGTLIRQLDTGEIVRFVYSDRSWDIRVKPVPLHTAMALGDLLDLTAKQLVESNASAEVVKKNTIKVGDADVGLIEARYNAGADRLFAQQALISEDNQSYYLIQMGSPTDKAKNAPADPPDPRETDAREVFTAMLPTVRLLDRGALRKEQEDRLRSTFGLWVLMDKKKVTESLIPQHFMRIVHDGKDVGFVQMNERLAAHGGNAGVEIIVRSREDDWAADAVDAVKPVAVAITPQPSTVVLPTPMVPITKPTVLAKPQSTYTSSTYFFSFDRPSGFVSSHEDWETISQIDEQKAAQVTELGNSDLAEHRVLDVARAATHIKTTDQQPPVIDRPEFLLSVSQYQRGHRLGRAFECQLGWSYLPQGLGQILPRLLPDDPQKYMFSSYESTQHSILRRYIDVDPAMDVSLDGKILHAVPISDRIGVDGVATIHYVTRAGEWLGSRNEESKVDVLPTSADELARIWPNFAICPEPPLPVDETPVAPALQKHMTPPAPLGSALQR